jgi:GDPmannose 4,6-dehydratase
VARICLGLQDAIYLGNLDAKRDWGHAKDYVKAMWLMLQQEKPEDYVIATGVTTSVRDLLVKSFKEMGVEIEFKGEGKNEIGYVKSCNDKSFKLEAGREVVKIDPNYYRPTEVDLLIGDPAKAKKQLGWKPEYDLDAMIKDMVTSDFELFKRDQYLLKGGHKVFNYHE